MTSVNQQQRTQRQLDLMLALGEAVMVEDPETGVVHYVATQKLLTMMQVEGRCDAVSGEPHRPRHAKEAPPSNWRVRTALVVIAGGLIMVTAMPAAVSMGGRPGVHRVIDDDVDPDDAPPPPTPAKAKVRASEMTVTRVAKATAKATVNKVSKRKRSKIAQVFTGGTGRHRARHNSHDRSGAYANESASKPGVWFPGQVGAMVQGSLDRLEQLSEHTHRHEVLARS